MIVHCRLVRVFHLNVRTMLSFRRKNFCSGEREREKMWDAYTPHTHAVIGKPNHLPRGGSRRIRLFVFDQGYAVALKCKVFEKSGRNSFVGVWAANVGGENTVDRCCRGPENYAERCSSRCRDGGGWGDGL